MAEEIVAQIKNICEREEVDDPDIFTEFGSYTVRKQKCRPLLYCATKRQNDRELWNMIDSSL